MPGTINIGMNMTQQHFPGYGPPRGVSHHHPQPSNKALGRPISVFSKKIENCLLIVFIALGVNQWDYISSHVRSFPFASLIGNSSVFASPPPSSGFPGDEALYLLDKASLFVSRPEDFELKVRDISSMLGIAPEWLMAVMYSESRFDASAVNLKGSGATGLIQFMAATAEEFGISIHRLEKMDHLQQLEYVYLYLDKVRQRYGDYRDLTDLYLGILYPKARGQDYCYTLYAKPSKQYQQNAGLDENHDGRVTVSDIEHRMKRLYPTAFVATVPTI